MSVQPVAGFKGACQGRLGDDCNGIFDGAGTIADVLDGVQAVVRAWRATAAAHPSWAPMEIHSRQDVEHWARRLSSWPRPVEDDQALAAMAEIMRSADQLIKELVPRRAVS